MKLYKNRLFFIFSIIAAGISLAVYYITKAPTVSFWDCGEFIASSYILGIPHPPGNPMFVILGRFFSMLPLAGEIAVRINLVSVISSAASVLMGYWIILRIATGNGKNQIEKPLDLIYALGALAGSLILGFSNTFWSNAVETEVYGLSIFIMLLVTYLALLWAERINQKDNDRLLVVISYLIWFSLGIHLTTFILIIPIIIYMGIIDYRNAGLVRWPVWLMMALFLLYAIPIQTQILGFFGVNIGAAELESTFLIMFLTFLAFLISWILIRKGNGPSKRSFGLASLIFLFAILGYSNQLYIPIRAAQKPIINENDPSDWRRFKAFLERKQYGQESMITRMLKRRGSWENQIIYHPRFGLIRKLSEQYSSPDAYLTLYDSKTLKSGEQIRVKLSLAIVYLIVFGLFGALEAARRSPPEGIFIILTMVLCTFGLAIYLNFSDGTYNTAFAPQAEVRNRDYFYTPGFVYFALIIGIGLVHALDYFFNRSKRIIGKIGLCTAILMAIFLPLHTALANFDNNDRRGNYIAYDYAYNMLQTCRPNSILFTNGDNDTFPLWFIQEVEKVRKDVKVVNLSLLNTSWYIFQMRDQAGIPITLDDSSINSIRPFRFQGQEMVWRVQDQMVKHIIENAQASGWQTQVYFAITVPQEGRLGLEDHLNLSGMAYRVDDSGSKGKINTGECFDFFVNRAKFRGIGDGSVSKDDNDERIINNYLAAMYNIIDELTGRGRADSAVIVLEKVEKLMGDNKSWQNAAYLSMMYAENSNLYKIRNLTMNMDKEAGEKMYISTAENLSRRNNSNLARQLCLQGLEIYPHSIPLLENFVMNSRKNGDTLSVRLSIERFKKENSPKMDLVEAADAIMAGQKPNLGLR